MSRALSWTHDTTVAAADNDAAIVNVGFQPVTRSTHPCAGVDVSALEAAAAAGGTAAKQGASVPRSPTTLLLKNLPWSTTREELEALCGRVGGLARLVLPSTRTLALVEYLEPQDARTYAFVMCHTCFSPHLYSATPIFMAYMLSASTRRCPRARHYFNHRLDCTTACCITGRLRRWPTAASTTCHCT